MRKPVISRTIKVTEVSVLGLNLETREPENRTYPMYASEIPKDESKFFDKVRALYESESYKISQIVDTKESEKIYTMPLEQFMELATCKEIYED